MIRKVQRITSFGVFEDFTWPATLHDFKQFNLLFGWNYSGKTTFSRTFRCFELVERHADFATAEVHMHCEGGTVHTLSTTAGPHHYRVFNVDFVKDNLFFDEGAAEPILVLGAADIAKQQALQNKKDQLATLLTEIQTAADQRKALETKLDKALTKTARDNIKTPLQRPNYDKTKLLQRVIACKNDPSAQVLSDSDYTRELDTYNSRDKKASLAPPSQPIWTSISDLSLRVDELTTRSVKAATIQAVATDPELEEWVKAGMHLHADSANCLFCGTSLPGNLLDRLRNHFSKDYDDLMDALGSTEAAIDSATKEQPKLPSATALYADLALDFGKVEEELSTHLEIRAGSLKSLREAVTAKGRLAYSSVPGPVVVDNSQTIATDLAAIDALIVSHNERSLQFDQNRDKAFTKLENHWASRLALDEDYAGTVLQIAQLKGDEEAKKTSKTALSHEINQIESEISEAVKGAETINSLLKAYFGKGDLQITIGDGSRFHITRNGSVAKNLSEGERSAIAFVHFVTRLLDERHPLSATTVIIDDPICSLDANHIFNTYAFMKTKLSTCYQLFILTHNYEFYSLIRDWAIDDEGNRAKKPQSEWNHWSIYLVRRTDDGTSTVESIPPELLRFKSEYHYLFATLLHFDSATTSAYDYLFSLPNVARRFMEAFGGIMIPTYQGLRPKLLRLIPDPVQRERVWKFINDYSHNQSLNRSLAIPDVSECKEIVSACLKAVEDWDDDYFNDLKTAVLS